MKILIIQTAFIGDVVLATPLVEKLHQVYPGATIDFVLRKGNERLLENHPYLRKIWIWDKKINKYSSFFSLLKQIRKEKYDYVINAQRFFMSGLMTVQSGGKQTIGFDKNPLSIFFSKKLPHHISADAVGDHEVKRNLTLISHLTDDTFIRPKLYPSKSDFEKIKPIGPYICIAPASVWFTKQYPKERWIDLINGIPHQYTIYLMGAKSDFDLCQDILAQAQNLPSGESFNEGGDFSRVINLAGQLSFLESAALMQGAAMNYVNDSAPLHFASAVNAPVTAIFCSTVPAFGFGPLSDRSFIAETRLQLTCRPCGLHGRKECPLGHFKCSVIETEQLLLSMNDSGESIL